MSDTPPPQQQQQESNASVKGEGDQHINVKVVNGEGIEVFFKIKKTTNLKKLMDAYCKRQGLNPATVRFTFDGNRISGNETAEQLEMEDQDVIDAMVEQTGGY
jgi:small ubiquitin-related modifier